MSFFCGFCGNSQPSGIKPVMVVTKVRQAGGKVRLKEGGGEFIPLFQTVEEKPACPECAAERRHLKPEVVGVT